MGTGAGTLSLCVAIAVMACGHLDRVPVVEVPIDQFQAAPAPSTPAASPTLTPLIDDTPPAATTTAASTTTPSAAPSKPGAAPSAAPAPIEPPDPAQDKIDQAKKLVATGKKADLEKAKRLLLADVGPGNGTPGEAKMLKTVCTKLADKACIAKANSYIK
jgi:hypothetical protein